jgi:hypothetical protein
LGIILSVSMLFLASISVVACSNGPSASTDEQIKALTARVTALESQIGNSSSPIRVSLSRENVRAYCSAVLSVGK